MKAKAEIWEDGGGSPAIIINLSEIPLKYKGWKVRVYKKYEKPKEEIKGNV